jgi:hypothetical protein
MRQDHEALALEFRTEERLKGLGDVSCCWFRPLRFLHDQLAELLIRNGIKNAPIDREGLGESPSVGRLRLLKLLGEAREGGIRTQHSIQVAAAIDFKKKIFRGTEKLVMLSEDALT